MTSIYEAATEIKAALVEGVQPELAAMVIQLTRIANSLENLVGTPSLSAKPAAPNTAAGPANPAVAAAKK